MKDLKTATGELNDEELNAVTGGSIVDSVADAAKTVWNISAHRDEVVLMHMALNPLGIYDGARTPEHGGDAPIAIEPVAQAE